MQMFGGSRGKPEPSLASMVTVTGSTPYTDADGTVNWVFATAPGTFTSKVALPVELVCFAPIDDTGGAQLLGAHVTHYRYVSVVVQLVTLSPGVTYTIDPDYSAVDQVSSPWIVRYNPHASENYPPQLPIDTVDRLEESIGGSDA